MYQYVLILVLQGSRTVISAEKPGDVFATWHCRLYGSGTVLRRGQTAHCSKQPFIAAPAFARTSCGSFKNNLDMFPNFRQSTCIFWVWVSGLILAGTFWNMWNPILFLMYYTDYMRESIHSTFGGTAGVLHLTSITQVDTCAAQWKPSLDLVWWGRRHEQRVRIIQYYSNVFCIKSFVRTLSFCPAQNFLLFPCLAWYWESSPAPILGVGLPIARRELNCEGAKSAALASCSEVRASASWICILALNLSPSLFVGRPAAGSSLSQSCQTAQKGQRWQFTVLSCLHSCQR